MVLLDSPVDAATALATKIVEHSFVVGIMILSFILFVWMLFINAKNYLAKIKNDSIANVQCMKAEIDKDVLRIENQLKSQLTEIDGVKERLHTLSNTVNNCNARSVEISHKIDLMLVRLGADAIKMAQDK